MRWIRFTKTPARLILLDNSNGGKPFVAVIPQPGAALGAPAEIALAQLGFRRHSATGTWVRAIEGLDTAQLQTAFPDARLEEMDPEAVWPGRKLHASQQPTAETHPPARVVTKSPPVSSMDFQPGAAGVPHPPSTAAPANSQPLQPASEEEPPAGAQGSGGDPLDALMLKLKNHPSLAATGEIETDEKGHLLAASVYSTQASGLVPVVRLGTWGDGRWYAQCGGEALEFNSLDGAVDQTEQIFQDYDRLVTSSPARMTLDLDDRATLQQPELAGPRDVLLELTLLGQGKHPDRDMWLSATPAHDYLAKLQSDYPEHFDRGSRYLERLPETLFAQMTGVAPGKRDLLMKLFQRVRAEAFAAQKAAQRDPRLAEAWSTLRDNLSSWLPDLAAADTLGLADTLREVQGQAVALVDGVENPGLFGELQDNLKQFSETYCQLVGSEGDEWLSDLIERAVRAEQEPQGLIDHLVGLPVYVDGNLAARRNAVVAAEEAQARAETVEPALADGSRPPGQGNDDFASSVASAGDVEGPAEESGVDVSAGSLGAAETHSESEELRQWTAAALLSGRRLRLGDRSWYIEVAANGDWLQCEYDHRRGVRVQSGMVHPDGIALTSQRAAAEVLAEELIRYQEEPLRALWRADVAMAAVEDEKVREEVTLDPAGAALLTELPEGMVSVAATAAHWAARAEQLGVTADGPYRGASSARIGNVLIRGYLGRGVEPAVVQVPAALWYEDGSLRVATLLSRSAAEDPTFQDLENTVVRSYEIISHPPVEIPGAGVVGLSISGNRQQDTLRLEAVPGLARRLLRASATADLLNPTAVRLTDLPLQADFSMALLAGQRIEHTETESYFALESRGDGEIPAYGWAWRSEAGDQLIDSSGSSFPTRRAAAADGAGLIAKIFQKIVEAPGEGLDKGFLGYREDHHWVALGDASRYREVQGGSTAVTDASAAAAAGTGGGFSDNSGLDVEEVPPSSHPEPDTTLKVVADSWKALRRQDVERLLETASEISHSHLSAVAQKLEAQRPDLYEEAMGVIEELAAGVPMLADDLEHDFKLRSIEILEYLDRQGSVAPLLRVAGVKSIDAFGELSIQERADAYVRFVAEGGTLAPPATEPYNDKVRRLEHEAEVRRLQQDRLVVQKNGKPFRTEASATQFRDEYQLDDTHQVVSEGKGFALSRLGEANRPSVLRRQAERRANDPAYQRQVAAFDRAEIIGGAAGAAVEAYENGDTSIEEFEKQLDAAEQQPRPTDPALDPERVARMAEGANRRLQAESAQREEAHSNPVSPFNQRLRAVEENAPEWVEWEGQKALRVKDSRFVALPASGRKNAARFVVVDTRDKSTSYANLTKREVYGWLTNQYLNELEERAEGSTPDVESTETEKGEADFSSTSGRTIPPNLLALSDDSLQAEQGHLRESLAEISQQLGSNEIGADSGSLNGEEALRQEAQAIRDQLEDLNAARAMVSVQARWPSLSGFEQVSIRRLGEQYPELGEAIREVEAGAHRGAPVSATSVNDGADQPVETSVEVSETPVEKRFRVRRGRLVEYLGANDAGKRLYEDAYGLRLQEMADGQLFAESPWVTPAGVLLPPKERSKEFLLPGEATALAVQRANDCKVVALRPLPVPPNPFERAAADRNYWQTIGVSPGVMVEYLTALSLSRKAKQDLARRHLGREVDRLATQIEQLAADNGYRVDFDQLEGFLERFDDIQEAQTRAEDGIATAADLRKLMDGVLVQRTPLSELRKLLDPEAVRQLPSAWVLAELSRLSGAGALPQYSNAEAILTHSLLFASAYGTAEEIQRAQAIFDGRDHEAAKAIIGELQETYWRERQIAEIPDQIRRLQDQNREYTGISPIPLEHNLKQIRDLYQTLALAQYDIGAIPIEEEDLRVYRETDAHAETVAAFAARHGFTHDAAELYLERVEQALTDQQVQAFAASREVAVTAEAWELLREHLIGYAKVSLGEGRSSPGLQFPWSYGEVRVSWPALKGDQYELEISVSDGGQGGLGVDYHEYTVHKYQDLPSPEQIVGDVLAFAARYKTNINAGLAPKFGEKRFSLGDAKYDHTLIAKKLRETIKDALRDGALPKGMKVSVRKNGGTIHLTIKALPADFALYSDEYLVWHAKREREGWQITDDRGPLRYTLEGAALMAALDRHLDAWNNSDSDEYGDYRRSNYYKSLSISRELDEELLSPEAVAGARVRLERRDAVLARLDRDARWKVEEFLRQGVLYLDDTRRDWVRQRLEDGFLENSSGAIEAVGNLVQPGQKEAALGSQAVEALSQLETLSSWPRVSTQAEVTRLGELLGLGDQHLHPAAGILLTLGLPGNSMPVRASLWREGDSTRLSVFVEGGVANYYRACRAASGDRLKIEWPLTPAWEPSTDLLAAPGTAAANWLAGAEAAQDEIPHYRSAVESPADIQALFDAVPKAKAAVSIGRGALVRLADFRGREQLVILSQTKGLPTVTFALSGQDDMGATRNVLRAAQLHSPDEDGNYQGFGGGEFVESKELVSSPQDELFYLLSGQPLIPEILGIDWNQELAGRALTPDAPDAGVPNISSRPAGVLEGGSSAGNDDRAGGPEGTPNKETLAPDSARVGQSSEQSGQSAAQKDQDQYISHGGADQHDLFGAAAPELNNEESADGGTLQSGGIGDASDADIEPQRESRAGAPAGIPAQDHDTAVPVGGAGDVRRETGRADRHDLGGGSGETVPSTPRKDNQGQPEAYANDDHHTVPSTGDGPQDAPAAGRDGQLQLDQLSSENISQALNGAGESFTARRVKDNLVAMAVAFRLSASRGQASPEDQNLLGQFSGWGGLEAVFVAEHWEGVRSLLERWQAAGFLSEKDRRSMEDSVLNAHYTPEYVAEEVWKTLESLGFEGGKVLEPSVGSGVFLKTAPANGPLKTHISGVELDRVTALITHYRFPKARIQHRGFEATTYDDNSFDAVISNVPFGDYGVFDPENPGERLLIHDHFILKSLQKTRVGGVCALITSVGTLDKVDTTAREKIAKHGDLIGVVRLPRGTFSETAQTSVSADVLIFRRREEGAPYAGLPFEKTVPVELPNISTRDIQLENGRIIKPGDEFEMPSNEVFDHGGKEVLPAGSMGISVGRFGPELTVKSESVDKIEADIRKTFEAVREGLREAHHERTLAPENSVLNQVTGSEAQELTGVNDDANDSHPALGPKVGNYWIASGTVFQIDRIVDEVNAEGERVFDIRKSQVALRGDKQRRMLVTAVNLRDQVKMLIHAEKNNAPAAQLDELRRSLNAKYNIYVKEFGYLGAPGNSRLIKHDTDAAYLLGLEFYDKKKKVGQKTTIFKQRVLRAQLQDEKPASLTEAIGQSMAAKGQIDPDWVSEKMGEAWEKLIEREPKAAFFDPAENRWEVGALYLSGDVKRKLKEAESAKNQGLNLSRNIRELKPIVPADIPAADVGWQLGTMWVPQHIWHRFLGDIIGQKVGAGDIEIFRMNLLGKWRIKANPKWLNENNALVTELFGTPDKPLPELLECAFNHKIPRVFVEEKDGRRIELKERSAAAQAKLEEIKDRFSAWKESAVDIQVMAAEIYNQKFNSLVMPEFTGEGMVFPGLADHWKPREHQAAICQAMSYDGTWCSAHCVGAGKTFEMVAGALCNKRMGRYTKPVIAIPNHMLWQIAGEAKDMFPEANILVVTKKDLAKENRRRFLAKVAMNNWDVVVMTHGVLSKIDVPEYIHEAVIDEEIGRLKDGLLALESLDGYEQQYTEKQVKSKIKKLEEKLAERKEKDKKKSDQSFTIADLGIDAIFLDEAHLFKNLDLNTGLQIPGVSSASSDKAWNLFLKTRYLYDLHGKEMGVNFFTGTPIANSVSETYTLKRYLRPSLLKNYGLESFEDWVSVYGDVKNDLELLPEGGGYQIKQRLSNFNNVPEMLLMLRNFVDVKTREDLNLPTPKVNYETVVAKPSPWQMLQSETLADRAKIVRSRGVEPKVDNLLSIVGAGRKGANDIRLVDPRLPREIGSKIDLVTLNLLENYHKHMDDRGTQLVFLDIGTPSRMSMLEFITDKLIKLGYEDDEIPAILGHRRKGQRFELTEMIRKNLARYGFSEEELENVAEGKIEKFNLYDDIKQVLLENGVPESEIAFIHDFETDQAKEDLYVQVRSGDVRFLFGSTQKLGVGTNVQERLCGLHNVDPPWRPADIEQRNGRIDRQGNMFDEVTIYNYTTEDSFDLFMWETMARKADFISKAMSDPRKASRTLDESTDMSYDDVVAVTTGDPRVREKVEVDGHVQRLVKAEASHNAALAKARRDIEWNEEEIRSNEALLDQYMAQLKCAHEYSTRVNDANHEYALEVPLAISGFQDGPTTWLDRTLAGKAFGKLMEQLRSEWQQELITAARNKALSEYRPQDRIIARVYGLDVTMVSSKPRRRGIVHDFDLIFYLEGTDNQIWCGEGESGSNTVTKLNNLVVRKLTEGTKDIKENIAFLKSSIESARRVAGQGEFPKQVELKELLDRKAELDKALSGIELDEEKMGDLIKLPSFADCVDYWIANGSEVGKVPDRLEVADSLRQEEDEIPLSQALEGLIGQSEVTQKSTQSPQDSSQEAAPVFH